MPEKWQRSASYNLLECPWPHDVVFVTIQTLGSGLADRSNYQTTTALFSQEFGDVSPCPISLIKFTTGQFLYQLLDVLFAVFKSLCRTKEIEIKHYSLTRF